MAKGPTGIQALAKISLEQVILKQNSKYPTTVFIVVSNLWFY
jgi:metal-dependent HD superfamily phosphatase/phosphodiesterase